MTNRGSARIALMIGVLSLVLASPVASGAVGLGATRSNTVPGRGHASAGVIPGRLRAAGDNVNISNKAGAQSETSIAIDPTNAKHLLAASNDLAGSGTTHVYESIDAGATWTLVNTGISGFCYDPWLDFNAAGDAFFAYECFGATTTQNVGFVKKGQANWTLQTLPGAGSVPDRDMIVLDTSSTSTFAGSAYIGYDDNGHNNTAYVEYSRDGFGGWTRSPKINDGSSTIGVSVAVGPNGTLYATWEDFNGKKIWTDRSPDGGATWGTDTVVTNYRLNTTPFFIHIPPQPQRGILPFPMTVVAQSGPHAGRLYAVYEDKGATGSDTNTYLRYSDDGGATWSSEVEVNDDTVNAYQFHSRVAVSPRGVVAVSFSDTRNDPANKKTDRFVAYSFDGGATFGANQKVTTAQSDESSAAGDANDYGDYQGMDAARVKAAVFALSWTDSRPGDQSEELYGAVVVGRQ